MPQYILPAGFMRRSLVETPVEGGLHDHLHCNFCWSAGKLVADGLVKAALYKSKFRPGDAEPRGGAKAVNYQKRWK